MSKLNKHLTLSDRIYIEQELLQATSFKQIGLMLEKDPTTISKEIKKHAITIPYQHNKARRKCNNCILWNDCKIRGGSPYMLACPSHRFCKAKCNRCWENQRDSYCSAYIPFICNKQRTAPYVCNACPSENSCNLEHKVYQAKTAQKEYEKTLSKSRKGINMTPDELLELNELISPLVLKGQPLSHIFSVHADEIPVCRRTLYNYFDQSVFKDFIANHFYWCIRQMRKSFQLCTTRKCSSVNFCQCSCFAKVNRTKHSTTIKTIYSNCFYACWNFKWSSLS